MPSRFAFDPTTMSPNSVVGVHYRVNKRIGEGSFGVIFEGTNMLNNQQVAIKFEPRKTDAPQLRDEYRTYKILAGSPGVPNVYYYGQEGLHNILVIDLLGPSLEDVFDLCGRRFSLKTTIMVAKQMVSRVQTIHEKHLIYRDIKPDNFLIGRPNTKTTNVVHVVDFGMAKQYRDPKTKQHIPYRERKSLSGTARYMSINTHLGREQSRRDDLEALGHVFIYFLRGGLPWQGLKAATNKQKYEKIGEKKQSTRIKDLCEGLPDEIGLYLTYCRDLGFEDTPDYDYLRDLLTSALEDTGEVEDGNYDWLKYHTVKDADGPKRRLSLGKRSFGRREATNPSAVDIRHSKTPEPILNDLPIPSKLPRQTYMNGGYMNTASGQPTGNPYHQNNPESSKVRLPDGSSPYPSAREHQDLRRKDKYAPKAPSPGTRPSPNTQRNIPLDLRDPPPPTKKPDGCLKRAFKVFFCGPFR